MDDQQVAESSPAETPLTETPTIEEPSITSPTVKIDQIFDAAYEEIIEPNSTRIDYSILTHEGKGLIIVHDGIGINDAKDHLSDNLDFALILCKHSEIIVVLVLYISNQISEERKNLANSYLEEIKSKFKVLTTTIGDKNTLTNSLINDVVINSNSLQREESELKPKRSTRKKKKEETNRDDDKTKENFLRKIEASRRRKEGSLDETSSRENGLKRAKSTRKAAKSDASLNRRNSLEEKPYSEQVSVKIQTPPLTVKSSTKSLETRHYKNFEDDPPRKTFHRKDLSTSSDASDDNRILYQAIEHHIAREEDELMFMKGDTIEVLNQNGDRWEGVCYGVQGYFNPSSVKEILRDHRRKDYSGSEMSDDVSIMSSESGIETESSELKSIEDSINFLFLLGFNEFVQLYKDKKLIDEGLVRKKLQTSYNMGEDQIRTVLTRTKKLNDSILKGINMVIPRLNELTLSDEQFTYHHSDKIYRDERVPIDNLDKKDFELAKKYAVINLTTKLEKKSRNKISTISTNLLFSLKSTIPREKNTDQYQVFGVELQEIILREGLLSTQEGKKKAIPNFLSTIFEKLNEEKMYTSEGIFRVPGNARKIQEIREECNKTAGKVDLSEAKHGDLTGVLKLFFKEMPDYLFTSDLYDSYLSVGGLKEDRSKITVLQLLSLLLPPENRCVAQELIEILYKVGSESAKTKMDYKNLAIVIAPSLFGNKKKLIKSNDTRALQKDRLKQEIITEVFEFMITQHQSIFLVEPEIYRNLAPSLEEEKPYSKSNKLSIYSSIIFKTRRRTPLHEKSPSS